VTKAKLDDIRIAGDCLCEEKPVSLADTRNILLRRERKSLPKYDITVSSRKNNYKKVYTEKIGKGIKKAFEEILADIE
jgi:hypothetical protein